MNPLRILSAIDQFLELPAMGPCDTSAMKRLLVPSESQSHVKKSKRSPETPWPSKWIKTNIDDLSDFLLVEILCRLPHNKLVFRCKCVCKRWSSLICDEKFQCRFLWLQSRPKRKLAPMGSSLIFRDAKKRREFFILPELELPMFKTHNFSLRFVPCFEAPVFIETNGDIPDMPIVVGTCNDLVLCCKTKSFQTDYYICNPYTKQFVHLPPTPGRYREVRVGFICDPYYKQEDIDEETSSSGIIQVDADFRYAIVRIVPLLSDYYSEPQFGFKVEIFSSETRNKWTESFIMSTLDFRLDNLDDNGGIACNGMLYWLHACGDFIVGMDPFFDSNNNYKAGCPYFRIIDTPFTTGSYLEQFTFAEDFLSVCRGGRRLRICHFSSSCLTEDKVPSMTVMEYLKDDQLGGGGKWCNVTGDVIDLNTMVFENPIINEWRNCFSEPMALAFHPNNEDILYLELFNHIVACNIRERKLNETTLTTPYTTMVPVGGGIFPFVLPRWPTPLPRLRLD